MTGLHVARTCGALAVAVALTLGLAACAGDDDAPPTDAAGIVTSAAPAGSGLEAADERAVHDHRLTMRQLREWEQAYENLAGISDHYREFQRRHEAFFGDDDEPNFDEMVAAFNGDAAVRRAIESAGISTRDFVLTGAALAGAFMLDRMRSAGMPDLTVPMISEQHITFVRDHNAEVERALERLGELDPMLHGDDDDDDDWRS